MIPFVIEEYQLSDNTILTIIDIENIDEVTLLRALDGRIIL